MSEIVLTSAMRNNLLALQNTALLQAQTQQRLSTGNKVNSALDNPVNFAASQSLTQRANAFSALIDGMNNSIQVIQAANTGITELSKLVNQATAIANTAASTVANTGGSWTSADISAANAANLGTTLLPSGQTFTI